MTKKKPPANPVTPQAVDAFSMYVHKWQDRLNLNDWRIVKSNKAASRTNMAEINRMDLPARLATYRIGEDFGSIPVTESSVEEIACHEMLHVFLKELIETAKESQTVTAETLESIEHGVINTLVRLLVPEN